MAEFCYEYLKKVFDVNEPVENIILSEDLHLCEGCAKCKHVVVDIRRSGIIKKFLLKLKPTSQLNRKNAGQETLHCIK